ncbi:MULTISPECIES: DUF2584 family protein [Pontibacillus]|uniref:DUF2584 family protein n=1 Tax=Pontibacillus chungwhensis TaxID=265426 RepID=A0ABY8UTE8_9BACI|nr:MULTISPECIES: DUF2584 family protein [Pontibacillus]MCD5322916.1 DUF2584 domain-containing protein [Pontibacillus sp. HN14]WIF96312.1 DUF2584 family protein [Pontibacillus chungwhensis]
MSMPLSLETRIITFGDEKRVEEKENVFELYLDRYCLFPVDELVEVLRTEDSEQTGTAKIVEMTWANGQTRLVYRLISLYSVN